MRKLLFNTLLTCFVISANGQIINSKLQNQIDKLKQSNVDTFLIYSFYCDGESIRLDTCSYNEQEYLFWVKENSYFIKKFDDCKTYKSILLNSINPFSFYIKFKDSINKEEIKMPSLITSKNSNKEITSILSHDCFYKMSFNLKKENISKKVSQYNLTFKKFDDGNMNRYYHYNQNTKLKALVNQLTQLIEQLNKEDQFKIE